MSNKTLAAVVVAFSMILALPLISRAFKSSPTRRTDNLEQSAVVDQEPVEAVPASAAPPQPAPRQPSIMTQMQFAQVRPGMTYAQCVQFIGSEGEPSGQDHGGDAQYRWQLVNAPSDTISTGEATLTFRNGALCGKGMSSSAGRNVAPGTMNISAALPSQRPAAPPYICRSVYDSIKNGCAYAECARLLGMEGRYAGRRTMSAGALAADGTPVPAIADVYVWHNPAIPATLTLSFREGKLSAREVSGGGWASGSVGGSR